ncbi:MAG TPA: AEC family transporter [Azospirillaceae bacterium]|nr:AEC family transporter [Azospirillaceae bacterium]
MIAFVSALAPVFLLILLGYALRHGKAVPDEFWAPAERLTYYVFFPALIVDELAKAALGDLNVLPMGTAMLGAVGLVGLGLFAARRHLPVLSGDLDGPGFTSVFQGAIRPNTYVGLATAGALFGPAGLTLTAVGIATVIPLVNVLAVMVLSRYGSNRTPGVGAAFAALVRNPIIIAVAIGATLHSVGGPPPVAGAMLQILAKAALPLGLLAVGAGLDLKAAREAGMPVLQSSVIKLMLLPGITALLGKLLGVQGLTLTIAVLFNALPASASAYVLARQMGGDHRMAAGIITTQTVLAAFTLPLALVVFGGLGLHP